MTVGTITLVLGGATASMFVSLVGRMWNHDRQFAKRASMALEETEGSAQSTVEDVKDELMRTKGKMEEIEEDALEEIGESVLRRLTDHDVRVIEESLTARNTTEDLERGASSFGNQIDALLSAMEENCIRAEKSRKEMDSVATSISDMGSTVQGFSGIAEAFGIINERVSENRTEISDIDESISMVIDAMNIPTREGRS